MSTLQDAAVRMQRLRFLLAGAELDAIIAWGGPNFHYVTGYQNYFDNPGGSLALVPADEAKDPLVIVASWVEDAARAASAIADIRTYPLWLEIGDIRQIRDGTQVPQPKPSPRFDLAGNMKMLADAVIAAGLDRGRIGIELNLVSVAAFEKLRAYLPHVRFVEAASVFTDLRAIKSEFEIDCIERATRLAEHGLRVLANTPLRGMNTADLKQVFDRACAEMAAEDPQSGYMGTRVTASIGGDVSPTITGGARIAGQEQVFFDCGVSVHGYGSDTGRTLLFGEPTGEQRRIMDAICAGMDAAIELMKPGVAMCDIFHAGQDAVRRCGLDWYTRGHIGHAMGLGLGEIAPYLSPVETRVLEPGMVIALETPLYVRGLGGFQVEECFVVTETGSRKFTTLPRDFMRAEL